MPTLPTLNRRHKVGLFLVLVAAGLSLFFEASAKQTAGIVLLGLAASWVFGNVRPRTLGFIFGSAALCAGAWFGYGYLKRRLEARREARGQAAYLKKFNDCVTRLKESIHLPPGFTDPRYLDGETPDGVCVSNPDITSGEAAAQHSAPQIDFSQYVTQPPVKQAHVEPKNWATMRGYDEAEKKGHDLRILRRCYFDAGTLPCLGQEEVIAELKSGERVEVLSEVVRASGGSDIRKVKFQQWAGWVEADALEIAH